MNINKMTIGDAREIAAMVMPQANDSRVPFVIGEAYFIRTCTYHLTGVIRAIVGGFLVLDRAAWVADSGRFSDALSTGALAEVEPMPDGTMVAIAAITDAAPWAHELPKEKK